MDLHSLRKSLLTVVGCAAIALAAPLASAWSEEDAGTSAARPPCSTSKLVVWMQNGLGSGAAGSVYYRLNITNAGGTPCILSGYPGVAAVDLEGRRVGKPAAPETNLEGIPLTALPGDTVHFQVRVTDAGNFPPAKCKETMAAGFRVAPPGGGGSKIVPFPFQTCAKPGEPVLGVGPIKHN